MRRTLPKKRFIPRVRFWHHGWWVQSVDPLGDGDKILEPGCTLPKKRTWFSMSQTCIGDSTKENWDCKSIKLEENLKREKAMAPHSSTLAWKIPWTEEPGRLQSMGSLRVGHDWATSLSLFTFMHWRRKWQPTPVFLPGESQGRRGLVGCRLWGRTESDTTEAT